MAYSIRLQRFDMEISSFFSCHPSWK